MSVQSRADTSSLHHYEVVLDKHLLSEAVTIFVILDYSYIY